MRTGGVSRLFDFCGTLTSLKEGYANFILKEKKLSFFFFFFNLILMYSDILIEIKICFSRENKNINRNTMSRPKTKEHNKQGINKNSSKKHQIIKL